MFSFAMAVVMVASLLASVIAVNPASAQSIDTALAETVPADSVIYMDVDLDQSSDQWTQVYALLERSGLSILVEEQADTSPEDLGDVAETFEFTGSAALVFTDAEALAGPGIADVTDQAMGAAADPAAMTEDIPEGMVVVFQPDDPAALHANFQQMVADEAENNAATVETVDYNGVTIEYWTSDDPEIAPTATALIGDTVVLSVRPDDIEPVIDTINGDVESLASNENFNAVSSAFTTDSLSFGYVNATVLNEALLSADPSLAELAAGYDASMAGYAGWNIYVDDAGFRMDTVTITTDGSVPSVLDPSMAERMPADSLFFVNGTDIANSGLSELLGTFLQFALADTGMTSTPDVTDVATPSIDETYAELERQLGFNIKTDLLDQMDGEWAISGTASAVFSDTPDVDIVFVSEVADEATVADTLEQINFIVGASLDNEAADISERQVEGGTLSVVTVADMWGPGAPGNIEWGVINGELLFGLGDGIDNYLDGTTEPLANDPVYQQTFDVLPAENLVSVQFLNLDRTIPMIEEAVMSMESSFEVLDNDEACGDYASQAEAQAAYDEDEFGLWNLDLDYDGEACEDFFVDIADTPTEPVASPESMTEDLQILSAASVSYVDGDTYRTSSIILIGE